MAGVFHFASLMVFFIGSLVFGICFYERPRLPRFLLAISTGIASAVVVVSVSAHSCQNGQPSMQWVIPSLCLTWILLLVPFKKITAAVAFFIFIGGLALSLHYASIVHNTVWVGVKTLSPHSKIQQVKSEWHSFLTGLYRPVHE